MASLKGQNLRIYTRSGDDYQVIAKSTNCTVNMNANTDDATHKDIVGLASRPTVTSKSWSVQVDSLDVLDMATMLTAIANMATFNIMWDESSTTDNQEALGQPFNRGGSAYLTDASFTFNDRENAAKSITFTGTGQLLNDVSPRTQDIEVVDSLTKGQFVRLFLSDDNSTTPSKVIAAAKQLSFHVSVSVEEATTKDTDGDWQIQEPTQLSYDISTSALVRSGDTITPSTQAQTLDKLETIYESSLPVKFLIANVSGANQRTKGTTIVSGSVVLTSLSIKGPDRQNATYDAQLQGYGSYTVGA